MISRNIITSVNSLNIALMVRHTEADCRGMGPLFMVELEIGLEDERVVSFAQAFCVCVSPHPRILRCRSPRVIPEAVYTWSKVRDVLADIGRHNS